MTDRRRAPRYVLYASVPADLAPLHDIVIERIEDGGLVALCPHAARHSENLSVQYSTGSGDIVTVGVGVVSSEPVLVGGRIRFRVRLRADHARGDDAEQGAPPGTPRPAVLMRRHAVNLRNISGGGCLVDASVPFECGAIAVLETTIDGRRCLEVARVTRVESGTGGRGAFLVGAEFLPLSPAGAASVRAAIAMLDSARR